MNSRKFWVAIISSIVLFINEAWGVDIEPTAVLAVITPILAWLGIQGIKDLRS